MPESSQNFEHLRQAARERGANVFGAASMESLATEPHPPALPDCSRFPFAISVGIHLSDAILEELDGSPTRQYAYHYKIVNYQLDNIGLVLLSLIQERGFNAYPVPASQVIEWDKNTGELSHKWVAYNAGLGWYGRNNLLINPKYGARVRYATILTDMPLETGVPINTDCGNCYNCLKVCPAGVIGKSREDFDLEKCTAKIKELRDKLNLGLYVCGPCIKACPGTRE
jgi:epoxyqueuosine reductase